MPPLRPPLGAVAAPLPPQLELFPEALAVRALDPRAVGGTRTRVRGVWLVHVGRDRTPHRVFHDRHGWYCEAHGPGCVAIHAARDEEARRAGEAADGA